MSQKVREFVRQSGVELQSSNNSDSNNEFARELEMEMERAERVRRPSFLRTPPRPPPRIAQVPERLQRNLINDRTYEGAFKEFENDPFANEFGDVNLNENNMRIVNNVMREFSNEPRQLEMTKLNPGMFNATVDSGFGQKDAVVDIKKILIKTPLPKTPIGEGLYLDTTQIIGRYGNMTQGFSHTRNAGPSGDMNKDYFTVQFKLTLSDGVNESKGVTVNLYRNGKIRFSGGFVGTDIANQPELIRRFIVNTYTDKQEFFYKPFVYNNLSGQFRVNGVFKKLAEIARTARQYGMTRASYEPELSPFMYAYFEDANLILSTSGNIQITGAKNPRDMLKDYDLAKKFVRELNANGQINITGEFDKGVKARAKAKPKAKPKAKAKTPSTRKYTKRTTSANQIFTAKMCARMKKTELVNLARRMGIVNLRVRTSDGSRGAKKDEICKKIMNKTGKNNVTFKNTNKNKNVTLTGAGNVFRVGRKICTDLKRDELLRVAAILNITPDAKETKASLCKKIEKVRNNLRQKPNTPRPSPRPKPTKAQVRRNVANKKRVEKRTEVMKKRGLDENSIRRDIKKLYGDKWVKRYNPNLNQDVRNMKSALNAINKGNKTGIPFKKDIDDVKKKVVNRWKMERRRELERKYLMNTVNVTGIAYNMRNDYRRAAANYIMNQKTKPSNKKMEDYRKYWLKFRANVNTNGNSRRTPRAASARIEKI